MRTANPVLNENTFSQAPSYGAAGTMTIQGVVNKTAILLFILGACAYYVWQKVLQPTPILTEERAIATSQQVAPFIMGGLFGGFILGMITTFARQWASITAPLYAVCEGFFLGGISAYFEITYPGIVGQAVLLTFGTLLSLLLAYKSGMIKVTDNFRLGIFAATGGIALFYLLTMILGFFKIQVPVVYGSSPLGIAFSFFVVVIAALNLVLDFDFIERGARTGAPKYMEWYGAFGLIVTLVWLYLEILRLLSKLMDNRR